MNPAYWILTFVLQGQPLGVYDYYAPMLERFETQAQCQAAHRKQTDTRRKETQCVQVPAGGEGKPPRPMKPSTATGPQDPAALKNPQLEPESAPREAAPFTKEELDKRIKAQKAAEKASAPATK